MKAISERPLKAVYVHFTDEEFERLLRAKGKQTWHDFFLAGSRLVVLTELEKRKHD